MSIFTELSDRNGKNCLSKDDDNKLKQARDLLSQVLYSDKFAREIPDGDDHCFHALLDKAILYIEDAHRADCQRKMDKNEPK